MQLTRLQGTVLLQTAVVEFEQKKKAQLQQLQEQEPRRLQEPARRTRERAAATAAVPTNLQYQRPLRLHDRPVEEVQFQ